MKTIRYSISVILHWLCNIVVAKDQNEAKEFMQKFEENDGPQMN